MFAHELVLRSEAGTGCDEVQSLDEHAVIGVGEVGGRGHEQRHVVCRSARGWAHEEGNPVLARLVREMHRVDPARQVLGQPKGGGRFPTGVVYIVLVEVDRVPLLGSVRPALLCPVPSRPGHCPSRELMQRSVAPALAGLDERAGGGTLREVPGEPGLLAGVSRRSGSHRERQATDPPVEVATAVLARKRPAPQPSNTTFAERERGVGRLALEEVSSRRPTGASRNRRLASAVRQFQFDAVPPTLFEGPVP